MNTRKSIRAMFLGYIALTVSLSGCASISIPALATSKPISTVIPASIDLITVSGFQFQIANISLDDAVQILGPSTSANNATDGHPITSHKGGLAFTPNGNVPIKATGDSVLILDILLKSGDMRKALEFEPTVIEEGIEKSAVEVFTDDVLREFYWIYDVKKSSHFSFLLKFPNDTILDLQPLLMRSAPPVIPNP